MHYLVSEPKGMASWVTIHPLDGKTKSRQFTLIATEDPAREGEELYEYLVVEKFSPILFRTLKRRTRRAKIGGLEVKFRGRKNLTVTVFRNGKQLASDTTHDAGTPTELAYDNGPHPRLIIYLDFRDAVGRWWVIPLQ